MRRRIFGQNFLRKRKKVKAGSLSYALVLTLLLGVLIGALVLFASYMELSSQKLLMENDDLNGLESIIKYGVVNYESYSIDDYPYNKGEVIYERKKWGLISLLQIEYESRSKNSYKETLFLGVREHDSLNIRIFENEKSLSLAGRVFIEGNIEMVTPSLENVFLSGTENTIKHKGRLVANIKKRPLLYDPFKEDVLDFIHKKDIENNKIENDFFRKPILIDFSEEDLRIGLKGHIVLKSNRTLVIKKEADVEDIIVKAPKVIIESGFQGRLQVFSSESIIVQDSVQLHYPSVLYVYNDTDNCRIEIGKESDIRGLIVCKGSTTSKDSQILVDEKTMVMGDVYCSESVSLKGTMVGTVYTGGFYIDTDESIYENTLMNCTMYLTPKDFLYIPFWEEENTNTKRSWDIIQRK